MAPPPEYDKEPKAPDKSATNIACEETKAIHNLVNDQQSNSDNKSSSTPASAEVENNKLVETLDDGQLRALLDEAITYKCPKDREGKSNLFKELLEEVEQDEQASEAAARGLSGSRAGVNRATVISGRGSRSRRALPHSNSLQDLVAALAAEPAPRRHHRAPPAPAPAPVSARAIHGGSLPSGVDTSFLLGEEPVRGAGYLATVRCVNPPPLAERRVSTDANCSSELDSLNRRSKPAFPMTYTARATLEIGSGAVCSGRAVTTTTASNQVRTPAPRHLRFTPPTAGPPHRLFQKRLYIPKKFQKRKKNKVLSEDIVEIEGIESNVIKETDGDTELYVKKEVNENKEVLKEISNSNTEMNDIREDTNEEIIIGKDDNKELNHIIEDNIDPKQFQLLSALIPKMSCDKAKSNGGGSKISTNPGAIKNKNTDMKYEPRGPQQNLQMKCQQDNKIKATTSFKEAKKDITSVPDIETNVSTKTEKTQVTNPATINAESDKRKEKDSATITTKSKKGKKKAATSNKVAILSKDKEINLNEPQISIAAKTGKQKGTSNTNLTFKNKEVTTYPIKATSFAKGGKKEITEPAMQKCKINLKPNTNAWTENINNWYDGLGSYLDVNYYEEHNPFYQVFNEDLANTSKQFGKFLGKPRRQYDQNTQNVSNTRYPDDFTADVSSNILSLNITPCDDIYKNAKYAKHDAAAVSFPLKKNKHKNKTTNKSVHRDNFETYVKHRNNGTVPSQMYRSNQEDKNLRWVLNNHIYPVDSTDSFIDYDYDYDDDLYRSRREYRERIGKYLVTPTLDDINPKNVKGMTVGKPLPEFEEFADTSANDNVTKLQIKNEKKKSWEETNIPTDIDNHQDLLVSSNDTKTTEDELEEFHDAIDLFFDLSIKSSTPIPDQNEIEVSDVTKNQIGTEVAIDLFFDLSIKSSTPIPDQNEIEVSDVTKNQIGTEVAPSASSSKTEVPTRVEDAKRKKGTVIPLVNEICHVSIYNNEHLCSSSQEKDWSCETEQVDLPPQQDNDKYIEFINVNPFSSNDTINENDVELVDISSNSRVKKDVLQDSNRPHTKLDEFADDCIIQSYKCFTEQKEIRKSDIFNNVVELVDMSSSGRRTKDIDEEVDQVLTMFDDCSNKREDVSFLKYLAEKQKLFQALEDSNIVDSTQKHSLVSKFSSLGNSEKVHVSGNGKLSECISEFKEEVSQAESHETNVYKVAAERKVLILMKSPRGQIVLTLPNAVFSNYYNINKPIAHTKDLVEEEDQSKETRNANSHLLNTVQQKNDSCNNKLNTEKPKSKKKKDSILEKTKIETANKKALIAIMFKNHSKSRRRDKSMSTVSMKEVDSAIPFSCITTPEVVASCNTTSSTSQSTVAVDPKPLQPASPLAPGGRPGEPPARAPSPPAAPAAPAPTPARDPAQAAPPQTPEQPRTVISSSFNGLPLSRPNYGSTGNTSQDEYKKSIDENGNSVQGFSSPLSGSSQHKKPRRKKSSKNETVIKSHQIDGYQGNKDLNEVLRFIESAADTSRAGKLGRAKHRDDADDKGGKKRSGTRKDKESKMKRATSMEELSCSRMEDLTDKPSPPARQPRHSDQAKAERRSWGDDARDAATRFFREEPGDVPVVPDTEFQTVTKKRKPRRRADDPPEPAGGDPPRAARPPESRARRVSAPPSDRSNDSNDDMDSVHSLPADAVAGGRGRGGGGNAAPVPAPVSYADIARTRHNIPDLIESCNFYSEERDRDRGCRERGLAVAETPISTGVVSVLADGYPALEARRRPPPPVNHTPLAKTAHTPLPRRDRKVERTEQISVRSTPGGEGSIGHVVREAEWPAPDVVADRRPAVILLDTAATPDMDGVTFGFDINETLLGGPARRPRCDLVRDALEGALPADAGGVPVPVPALAPGVPVGPACGLRYVAPAPPPDTHHLHQIVDYVGTAWEDVVRLGAGKVRYYSE